MVGVPITDEPVIGLTDAVGAQEKVTGNVPVLVTVKLALLPAHIVTGVDMIT